MSLFSILLPKRALLLATVDYALLAAGFLIAVLLAHPLAPSVYLLNEGGLEAIAILAGMGILGMFLMDRYSNVRVTSRTFLAIDVASVCGVIFLGNATLLYLGLDYLVLTSSVLVAGVLLSAVLLVTWRIMYSEIISAALPTERILFLGYVPEVAEVSEEIRSQPVLGMSVIGYLSDQPIAGVPAGIKYLGDFDQIGHILDTRRPSRMIVASADLRLPRLQECLFALHQRQTAIERFGSFYEQVLRRVCTSELRPSAVIIDRELDTQPRKLALQSVYTNLVAFVGAAVIFPIMIAIAAAIRATSRMPAIEGLRRMGRNGLPFTLYQFRCHDTHGRRTRIGLWLRRHSLHKLPQLLNILRGEMALIGPPPERPEFSDILSRYMPYVGQRRSVRPGLIGLSQLYCDGSIKPVDEITRIEYDFYYIKHISLSMDVYIILASIRVALGVFATAEAKE